VLQPGTLMVPGFALRFSSNGTTPPKINAESIDFWGGTAAVGHATGMSLVRPLLAYRGKERLDGLG